MSGTAKNTNARPPAEARPACVIDARVHLPRPGGQPGRADKSLNTWFKQPKRFREGGTLENMMAEMDAAGVDKSVLVTAPGRTLLDGRGQGHLATSSGYSDEVFDFLCEEIAEPVSRFPERFLGVAMLDPMGGAAAVRQAERAISEYGFKGCAIMPALSGVAPDDPMYFPIYEKCAELGAVLTINLGMPGPMRSSASQMPLLLEEVLLTYPELKLAACHLGHPWHAEVLWLMERFENFHLITSAWAPKYIPDVVLDYMRETDSERVLWATDYPLLSFERSLREACELEIGKTALEGFLFRAAEKLYWSGA